MSDAGWFTDPSGRFGRRWYDGAAWTADVVLADGSVSTDALPERDAPYPPPSQAERTPATAPEPAPAPSPEPAPTTPERAVPPPPAYPPPPAPGYAPPPPTQEPAYQSPGAFQGGAYRGGGQQPGGFQPGGTPAFPAYGSTPPAYGAPAAGGSGATGIGLGLIASVLGLLFVILSLFVLKWASASNTTFLDLGKLVRANKDNVDGNIWLYASYFGFVLFGIVVLMIGLSALPLPNGLLSVARIFGTFVAGLAMVIHTLEVVRIFGADHAPSPQFGAWIGIVGYFLVVAGLTAGSRRPLR